MVAEPIFARTLYDIEELVFHMMVVKRAAGFAWWYFAVADAEIGKSKVFSERRIVAFEERSLRPVFKGEIGRVDDRLNICRHRVLRFDEKTLLSGGKCNSDFEKSRVWAARNQPSIPAFQVGGLSERRT